MQRKETLSACPFERREIHAAAKLSHQRGLSMLAGNVMIFQIRAAFETQTGISGKWKLFGKIQKLSGTPQEKPTGPDPIDAGRLCSSVITEGS